MESARGHGVQLTGNEVLLTALTQKVLQSALEAEMADHLGRDRYERAGDPAGHSGPNMDRPGRALNVRNGSYPKTLRTEVGEVTVQVPRGSGGVIRAGDRG